MSHNGTKLNEDKTERIIFNGCGISEYVTLTVTVGAQSTHIRSLGVRLDAELLSLRLRICVEPRITICRK